MGRGVPVRRRWALCPPGAGSADGGPFPPGAAPHPAGGTFPRGAPAGTFARGGERRTDGGSAGRAAAAAGPSVLLPGFAPLLPPALSPLLLPPPPPAARPAPCPGVPWSRRTVSDPAGRRRSGLAVPHLPGGGKVTGRALPGAAVTALPGTGGDPRSGEGPAGLPGPGPGQRFPAMPQPALGAEQKPSAAAAFGFPFAPVRGERSRSGPGAESSPQGKET